MTKTKTDSTKVNMTKAKTNKFQHKTVCNADTLKSCLNKTSAIVTKYYTVIDLTDDLNTKEYVTEVSTVIEIIDLTD
jgi:ATP-dependent Clp protease adapter protein ClpS